MSRQLYCRNCGKKIENENALFCVGCGKRLDPPDEPKTDDKADALKEQKAVEDTVVPTEEKTEDKPEGTILSQSRSATSNISKGDEITVEIAKKPVVLEPLDNNNNGEESNNNEQNNQDNQ